MRKVIVALTGWFLIVAGAAAQGDALEGRLMAQLAEMTTMLERGDKASIEHFTIRYLNPQDMDRAIESDGFAGLIEGFDAERQQHLIELLRAAGQMTPLYDEADAAYVFEMADGDTRIVFRYCETFDRFYIDN